MVLRKFEEYSLIKGYGSLWDPSQSRGETAVLRFHQLVDTYPPCSRFVGFCGLGSCRISGRGVMFTSLRCSDS